MPALVFPAPGAPTGTRYQFNFASFDVAPITGATIKNLLLQSQSITTAPWINGPFRVVNDYLFDIDQPDSTVKFYTNDTGIATPSNPSVIGSGNATAIVSTSINQFFGQRVTVRPNTTYTFSFYALRGTATDVTYGVYDLNTASDLVTPTSYYSSINDTTWTRVQFTFTTGRNTEKIIVYPLYNLAAGQTPGTNFITALQLEPGSVANTYQPTFDTLYTNDNASVSRVVSKLSAVTRVKSPAATPALVSKLSSPLIKINPPSVSTVSVAKIKAPITVRRVLPDSLSNIVSLSRYDNQGYTDSSFTTSTVTVLSIGNSGTSTYQTTVANTLNYALEQEPWTQSSYATADLTFNTQTNIAVNLTLSPFGVGGYVSISNAATGVPDVFQVISKVAANIIKVASSSTYSLGQIRLGSTITYVSPSVAQRSQILISTIGLDKQQSYTPMQTAILAEYAKFKLSSTIYDPIPAGRNLQQVLPYTTNTFLARYDNQGIIDTSVPSKTLSTIIIPEIVAKNTTIYNDYIIEGEPFTQLNYARLIFSPSGTFSGVATGETVIAPTASGSTSVETVFIVPNGVTKLSFFAVGPGGNSQNATTGGFYGGSGGGGSLYVNDLYVVPGSSITIRIANTSTIDVNVKQGDTTIIYNGKQYIAQGGISGNIRTGGAGGSASWTGTAGVDFVNAVPGVGGTGGSYVGSGTPYGAGGGGAAGYGSSGTFATGGNSSGSGASTGVGQGGEVAAGQPGGGGGARDPANGGGGNGSGGGGIGLVGRGSAGTGGTSGTSGNSGGGGGGSGGESIGANTPRGGDYGGGAAACGGYGGRGAVRFIWSTNAYRVYPTTNVGDFGISNTLSITFPSTPTFATGGWINAYDITTGLDANFQVAEYNNSYQYNSLLISSPSTINTRLFTTSTVIKSLSPSVIYNSQLQSSVTSNYRKQPLATYERYIIGDIMPWLLNGSLTVLDIVEKGIAGFSKNISADTIRKITYDRPGPGYNWTSTVGRVTRPSPFGSLFAIQPIPKSTTTSVSILSKQVWRNTGFITTSTLITPLSRYDNQGLTDNSFTTGTVKISFATTATSVIINGYTTSTVNTTLTNFITVFYPSTIVTNTSGILPAFPAGSYVRVVDSTTTLGTQYFQVLKKIPTSASLLGYSVSFPGNRYSLIAYNAAHVLGSGNFTFEAWIYSTVGGVVQGIVQTWSIGGQFVWEKTAANVIRFSFNNGSDFTESYLGTQTIATNAWYHVAVVRIGTALSFYVNGQLDVTRTLAAGTTLAYYQSAGKSIAIGANADFNGTQFTGFISQLRIVKGLGVYTGNFTVPRTSLAATQGSGTNIQAITNQTLLLYGHTSTLIDGSSNNWTLTAGGGQPAPTVSSTFPPYIFNWSTPQTSGNDAIIIGSSTPIDELLFTTNTVITSVSPSIADQSQLLIPTLNLRPKNPSGYTPMQRYILGVYSPSHLRSLEVDFDVPIQYITSLGKIRSTIPFKTVQRNDNVSPLSKYTNFLFTSTNVISLVSSYPVSWQTVDQYGLKNEWDEILTPVNYTRKYALLPVANRSLFKTGDEILLTDSVTTATATILNIELLPSNGSYVRILYETTSTSLPTTLTDTWTVQGYSSDYSNQNVVNSVNRTKLYSEINYNYPWNLLYFSTEVLRKQRAISYFIDRNLGDLATGIKFDKLSTYDNVGLTTGTAKLVTDLQDIYPVLGVGNVSTSDFITTYINETDVVTQTASTSSTITYYFPVQPNVPFPTGSTVYVKNPNFLFTPLAGRGSVEFTGGYLSVTQSSEFEFFAYDDFTIEMWVYPRSYNGYNIVGPSLFGTLNGDLSGYSINFGTDIDTFRILGDATGEYGDILYAGIGNGPALNEWSHIAVTRYGDKLSIWKNGVELNYVGGADIWNFVGQYEALIGRFTDGGYDRYFDGYISNLRIVKGTALYTTNFSPSTTPFEVVANTSLLTLRGNSYVDDGPNNFTVTPHNGVAIELHNIRVNSTSSVTTFVDERTDIVQLGSSTMTEIFNNGYPGIYNIDDWYYDLTLPFNIVFNGTTYSSAAVLTNSGIQFGGTYDPANWYDGIDYDMPDAGWTPDPTGPGLLGVPGLYISSYNNTTYKIYTKTDGSAPNRTFRVRYEGYGFIYDPVTPTQVWEIVFYENNPGIYDVVVILDNRGTNGATGATDGTAWLNTGDIRTPFVSTPYSVTTTGTTYVQQLVSPFPAPEPRFGYYYKLLSNTGTNYSVTINRPQSYPTGSGTVLAKTAGQTITMSFDPIGSSIPYPAGSWVKVTNSVTRLSYDLQVTQGTVNSISVIKPEDNVEFTAGINSIISTSIDVWPQMINPSITNTSTARQNYFLFNLGPGIRSGVKTLAPEPISATYLFPAKVGIPTKFTVPDARRQVLSPAVVRPLNFIRLPYNEQLLKTGKLKTIAPAISTPIPVHYFKVARTGLPVNFVKPPYVSTPTIESSTVTSRLIFDEPTQVFGRSGSTSTTVAWWINEEEILNTYTTSTGYVTLYFDRPNRFYPYTKVNILQSNANYDRVFDVINYSTSTVTITDPGDLPSISNMFARMGQAVTSTNYTSIIPTTVPFFRFKVGTTEIQRLPEFSFYKFTPFKFVEVKNQSHNKIISHSTFDNVGFTTGTNIAITGVNDFVYVTGRSSQYTSNIIEEYIFDNEVVVQNLVTATTVTLYFPATEYNYFPAGTSVNLVATYDLLKSAGFYNTIVSVTTSTSDSITFNDPGDLPISTYLSINKVAGSLVTAKFAQTGSVVPFASSSTIRITNTSTTDVMNTNVTYGLYNLVTFVKTTDFFDFTSLATNIISTSVPIYLKSDVRPTARPINARENLFFGELAGGTRYSLTVNFGITPTGITDKLSANTINRDSFKLRDLINYVPVSKLQNIAQKIKEPRTVLLSSNLQKPITTLKELFDADRYDLTHLNKQLFQLRAERSDTIVTTTSTTSRTLFEVAPNYVTGRTGSTSTTVSWWINEDEILTTYTTSTAAVTLYFAPGKEFNYTLVRLKKQSDVGLYDHTFNIVSRTIDSVTILDPGNLPSISGMEAYLGQTIVSIDSTYKYPNFAYRFEQFKPYGPIVGTQVFSLPPTMAKLIAAAQVRSETNRFRADAIKAIASPVKDPTSVVRADALQKQLFKLTDVRRYPTATTSTSITSILYDNVPAQITGRSGSSNNLLDYFFDNADLFQTVLVDKLTTEDNLILSLENNIDSLGVDTAGHIVKLLFSVNRADRSYPYTKVRLVQPNANFDQVFDILTYTNDYVIIVDPLFLPSISGMVAYFGYESTIVSTQAIEPTTVTLVEKYKISANSIFLTVPTADKLAAMQVLRGDRIRFPINKLTASTVLRSENSNLRIFTETEFITQSSVSALNPRTSGGVPRVSLYWATIAQGLRTKLYLQPIVTHNLTVAMSDIVEKTDTVVSTTSTQVTNFTGPLVKIVGRNPLAGNNVVANYLALDITSEYLYVTNTITTSTVTLYFAPSQYLGSGDKIKISQPDPDGIFYEQVVSVISSTNDSVTFNDPGNIPSTSGLFIQWGRTVTVQDNTYATQTNTRLKQVDELEKQLFKLRDVTPLDTFRVVNVDQRPKLKTDSIRLSVDKMQSMQVVRPAYNEIRLGRDLIEKLKVPKSNTFVFETPKITPGRQTEYLRPDPNWQRWVQPYMKFGLVVKQINKSTFTTEQLQLQLFKLRADRTLNSFTTARVSTLDRLKEPRFNLRYETLEKPITKLFTDRTGFGVGNPQIERLRVYKLDLTQIFETPKASNLARDSFKLVGERIVFKAEKVNTVTKLIDGQNNIKTEYLQKQLFQLRPDRGNATLVSSTVTSRVIYDNIPADIVGTNEHTADTVVWFMDNTDILTVRNNTSTNVVLYFATPRTDRNYAYTSVRIAQANAFYDRTFNIIEYTNTSVTISKPDWLPSTSGMQAFFGHTINEVTYTNIPPVTAPMVNKFTAVSTRNSVFGVDPAISFREQLRLRPPASIVRTDKLTTQDILKSTANNIKTAVVKTPLFVKDTFANKLDLLAKVKTVTTLRAEKVRRTLTSTTASDYTYFDNLPVRVVGRSGYITNTVDWFMDNDQILRVIPSGSSILTLYFDESRLFDYKLIRIVKEIEGGIYDRTYDIISYSSNSASFLDPGDLPSTSGMIVYLGQTVSITRTITVPPNNVDLIIRQKVFAKDISVIDSGISFAQLNKKLFGLKEDTVRLVTGNTRSISKLVGDKVSRTTVTTTSTSRMIYDNVPAQITGRDGFVTNTVSWFMDDEQILRVIPLGSSLIKLYFAESRVNRNYAYTSVIITQPNAYYNRTFSIVEYTNDYVTINDPGDLPSISSMQAQFGYSTTDLVTRSVSPNVIDSFAKLKVSYRDVEFFDINDPYYGVQLFKIAQEQRPQFNVTPKLTSAQVLRDLRNNISTGKVTSAAKIVEARAKIASESLVKQLMQLRADKVDTFNRKTPIDLLGRFTVAKLEKPEVFFTPGFNLLEKQLFKLVDSRSKLTVDKLSTVSALFETRTRLAIENLSKRIFNLTDVRKDRVLKVDLLTKFIGTANNNQVFYTPSVSKLTAMQVLRGDNIRRAVADRLMAAVVVRGETSRFRATVINKPITRLIADSNGALLENLTHLRHIQDSIFIGAPTYTVTATTEIQRQVTGRNDTVFENVIQESLDLGLINVIQSTPTPNTTATLYFAPIGSVVPYVAGSYVTIVSTAVYPIYQRNVQVTTSTNSSISFIEPGDLPSISTLSIYKGQSEFITLSFVPQNITKPAYPEGSSIQIRNTVTNTTVFAQVVSATTGSVTIIKPVNWIDTTALQTTISIASGELFPRTSVRTTLAPKNPRENLFYFEMVPGLRYNLSIQQALAFAKDTDVPLTNNLSRFDNVGLTEGPTVSVLLTTDQILSVTGRTSQFSTNLLQYFFDENNNNVLTVTPLAPQETVTLSFVNPLNLIPYPSGSYVTLRSNPNPYEAASYERVVQVLVGTQGDITFSDPGDLPSISALTIQSKQIKDVTVYFTPVAGTVVPPFAVGTYIQLTNPTTGSTVTAPVTATGLNFVTFTKPVEELFSGLNTRIISASVSVVPTLSVRTILPPTNPRERLYYSQIAPGYRNNATIQRGETFGVVYDQLTRVDLIPKNSPIIRMYTYNTVIIDTGKLNRVYEKFRAVEQSHRYLNFLARKPQVLKNPDYLGKLHLPVGGFRSLKFGLFNGQMEDPQIYLGVIRGLVGRLRTGDFAPGNRGFKDIAAPKKEPIQFWN